MHYKNDLFVFYLTDLRQNPGIEYDEDQVSLEPVSDSTLAVITM